MNKKAISGLIIIIVAFGLVLGIRQWRAHTSLVVAPSQSLDRLILLIPDSASLADPRVTIWLDAANEEGLHVEAEKTSAFLARDGNDVPAGVILPDKVHASMDDPLVAALHRYVSAGGNLFQTFDAGTLDARGFYAPGKSRLSDLAGVNYALYEELRERSTALGPLYATEATLQALEIQPGKYIQSPDKNSSGKPLFSLAGYKRPALTYSTFATRGNYGGRTLFTAPHGLAAGVSKFGKGQVLFSNIPLGYLAGRTDSMLLHSLLRYFAVRVLALPRLAAVPDGVGGLIMNWHVDSNADISYILHKMQALGIYEQGPYSIHVTAGPDTRRPGDGLGVNVAGNPQIQKWLRGQVARGNAIGSHGGWIHNYFGTNLSDKETPQFENYLAWNKLTLEKATDKPVMEYSAPQGNHPRWVSQWLADRGVIAYYSTGNSGMAPTRNYRDGKPEVKLPSFWAFPVSNMGTAGSFEELYWGHMSSQIVERWLRDMTQFSSSAATCRLIYFHPNATRLYRNAIKGWLGEAKQESKKGAFRWHSMTALANFLNQRQDVKWSVTSGSNGSRIFAAQHPQSLRQQTWFLPAQKYSEPVVQQGQATVKRSNNGWMVMAGEGKTLKFSSHTVG